MFLQMIKVEELYCFNKCKIFKETCLVFMYMMLFVFKHDYVNTREHKYAHN